MSTPNKNPDNHIPDIMKEDDLLTIANYFFIEMTPFNQVLGMRVEWAETESICLGFDMKEDLIGNTFRGLIHGGVTASILDVAGGIAAFFSLRNKLKGQSLEKVTQKFSKFGTIDLRIDYLRPGVGESFTATGSILRTGSKVAVARMELHNEKGRLLATGTGSYMVG